MRVSEIGLAWSVQVGEGVAAVGSVGQREIGQDMLADEQDLCLSLSSGGHIVAQFVVAGSFGLLGPNLRFPFAQLEARIRQKTPTRFRDSFRFRQSFLRGRLRATVVWFFS